MKPTNPRNKLLANQQEAIRQAVELIFAVLLQRFNIVYKPPRLFDKSNMENIMYTCCIIHNMVVKVRRESYSGTKKCESHKFAGIRRLACYIDNRA
jgi:Plant transposon protein